MAEVEEVVSTPTSEVNEKPKLDSLGRAYSTGKRRNGNYTSPKNGVEGTGWQQEGLISFTS